MNQNVTDDGEEIIAEPNILWNEEGNPYISADDKEQTILWIIQNNGIVGQQKQIFLKMEPTMALQEAIELKLKLPGGLTGVPPKEKYEGLDEAVDDFLTLPLDEQKAAYLAAGDHYVDDEGMVKRKIDEATLSQNRIKGVDRGFGTTRAGQAQAVQDLDDRANAILAEEYGLDFNDETFPDLGEE